MMTVKLIKTRQEYRAALRRVEELMDARPGTADGDELELLAAIIEIYEAKHAPVPPPDPIEAIRFRMEQENLRPQDLVPLLGSRSRVSEVLNGKRPLTLTMIRRLHHSLGIPAEVLLGETKHARLRTA
jgi:HTH-type transcriptional regulator / antitoxin HigA